ncbi:PilC/PilY family type IV pilus protein [uncultured Desulfuromusa sp.]|uniref:PilC/PilY family type IV pilus protein n=1 Tax=uncultured Desulfuromusa sp. TaxID=219183 RepID=UPI002AA70C1D|nr:PilC/PilY family type IV pilus protein [uncultured Desulfuromusa sp.]
MLKRDLLLICCLCLFAPAAFAGDIDISNTPMETKVQSAPPLVMFLMDDSGSMDWEVMTPELDGKFGGDEYVLPEVGSNYSGDVLSGSERLEWKSQWSGYNKIFYNPQTSYRPWPGKADASTLTPLGNAHSGTATLDLNAEYTSVNLTFTGQIVGDNDDSTYTEIGSWINSSSPDPYGGSARYTSTESSATWSLTIPEAGSYDVYSWWNCYNDRDQHAQYTIKHAGSTTIINDVNQRDELGNTCGDWVLLGGPYSFDVGTGDSVSVARHSGSNGNSTLADAIRLLPAGSVSSGSVLSIKNAHYYTKDSDGNTYLVNFDPVNVTRSYYLLNDQDSNDRVDDEELTLVAEADIPTSIKKAKYDEDGNIIGYYTAAEDLQNFANWYTFFRRREFTVKAAVSQSVREMEGVKVGFHTINHTVIQPVLPIKLDMSANEVVVVDDSDAGYNESGNWTDSNSSSPYDNGARYTTSSGSSATWNLNIPSTGTYNVYAWWNCYSDRDQHARYTINHAGSTTTINDVNQRDASGNTCGEWVLLGGPYTFNEGTGDSISVTRHSGSNGSSTVADAVMVESTTVSYANFDETDTLLDQIYSIDSNGGTPLRQGLQDIGQYYDQDDGNSGNIGTSPFSSETDGGACQKSYAIAMTDGFWNGSSPGVGNTDNDDTSYSGVAPYTDSYSDTLADVAMQYYFEDIANSLTNIVPTSSCDQASHQHMVTYSVSFGVTGTLDPDDLDADGNPGPYYEDDPCFLNEATPTPTWTNPGSGDSEKIDDLWHAAVNGRGLYFNAQSPEQLVDALTEIVAATSKPASGASVSVNSNELQEGLAVYQTRYVANEWSGDVVAYPVDPYSGAILNTESDILWHARDEIQDISYLNRKIVTYDGSVGINFSYGSLTNTQKELLLFATEDPSTDVDLATARLDYLRGRNDEVSTYSFRYRERNLGDIVHSAPSLSPDSETIYVGANDGMLHAIDTETGEERFAYVPNLVFANLKNLTKSDYEHQFFVDLTPTVKALSSKLTMLAGGLGNGGKGVFTLKLYEEDSSGNVIIDADSYNTSTPVATIANMVQWEYPIVGSVDDDLGNIYSKPAIVRSNDPNYEWVIIVGNGYSSTNETAALYIFSLNGTLIKKIMTEASGSNGLSEPSIIDANGDYKADYAYAGDLNGNMWKFDLTSTSSTNWDIAYKDESNSPAPLFTALGQPITSRPDVMYHCKKHGYMVVFGTGKFLGESDRTDNTVQTIYGLWDYGDDSDDSEYLGQVSTRTASDAELSRNNLKLLRQTVVDARFIDSSLYRTLSDNQPISTGTLPQLWPVADDSTEGQKSDPTLYAGWFFDLRPEEDSDDDNDDDSYVGERVVKDVIISNGRAFIVSFVPNSSPCSGGGDSFLYIMDACDGGRLDTAQFNLTTDDDLIEITVDGEPVRVAPTGKAYAGMLHEPTFVSTSGEKDKIYISSTTGEIIEEDVEKDKVGTFYWRLLN